MDLHKELYPSLFTKECENNPNIIVVYRIRGSKKLGHRIIEAKTEKLIEDQLIGIEINDFLKNVSFKNVKAVIFNISDHDREVSDVDYDVKMREKIATVLRSIKVPYLFVNDKTFAAMNALMCATIVPKIDERILAITILINKFSIIELLRKNNGYEIIERREIKCDKEDTNFKKLRSDILGKNAPAKIIVTSLLPVFMHPEIMKKLKNHILNSEFLIICDDEHVFTEKSDKNMLKIPCAVVRNLYDPNFTKYHIIPSCQATFCISDKRTLNNQKDIIIHVSKYQTLPMSYQLTHDEITNGPFYIFCYDKKEEVYMHVKTVKFDTYKNALVNKMLLYFGVDENDIPFLYHKSWTEGELMNLTCEVPVLGFFRNLSYIHIKNEENPMKEYDFLETWSDRFGSETFLSFEEEKPKLISTMDNINNANCVIKVQDIIKVISMPSDNIVFDPKWNFTVTSNSENPILITFENFDEQSSSASPAFLMALIFKSMLQLIREKTKIKVEQIGIYFLDKNFESEEKQRIEDGFEEACKLLNVEYFSTEEICATRPMTPRERAEVLASFRKMVAPASLKE